MCSVVLRREEKREEEERERSGAERELGRGCESL
jgi:hypothetical protein